MEPNSLLPPTVPPIAPVLPVAPKPKSPALIIILFPLLIIVFVVCFLAYKAFTGSSTPSPTPVMTSTPLPTVSANPDPTANWKAYQSKELNLTFKAPFNLNINIVGSVITIQDYPFNAPPPDNYYKAVVTVGNKVIANVVGPKAQKDLTDSIIATFKFGKDLKCVVAGCSGELCVAEGAGEAASICIWKDQHACYKTAKCELQTGGVCGWTEDPKLKACLSGS